MRTIALAILLVAAHGAAREAHSTIELEAEALRRGDALLAGYTTEQQLTRHLGHKPFACAAVGNDRRICNWRLGNRDSSWRALAASVPTDDRINVVCELPSDGSARAPGTCSIHPRRSNRYEWKPNPGSAKKRMKNRFDRESQKQRQQRANAMLAAARTPLEVSRLVGEGPQECSGAPNGFYGCLWHATSHTWGHGTLVMAIAAPISKKVTAHCTFPADGSPRAPETCSVVIGILPQAAF